MHDPTKRLIGSWFYIEEYDNRTGYFLLSNDGGQILEATSGFVYYERYSVNSDPDYALTLLINLTDNDKREVSFFTDKNKYVESFNNAYDHALEIHNKHKIKTA